jgi:4-aminobutyrate aminotransferase-like enzyme
LPKQAHYTVKMAPSETLSAVSATHDEPAAKKVRISNDATVKVSSAETMELERDYSAHNYHPLPVVFAKALGAKVWDPEGNEYLDFLSACISMP